MISPQDTQNSPKVNSTSKKSSIVEVASNNAKPVMNLGAHDLYPARCFESVMPPPPHNVYNGLYNNNNNSTKTYNRNHQKRAHRDNNYKNNDRQVVVTYDLKLDNSDNAANPKSHSTKKQGENKNNHVKQHKYGRNGTNHNINGENHLYNSPNGHNTEYVNMYSDHFFTYVPPTSMAGYFHKQKFYPRQPRVYKTRRPMPFTSEYHETLVDLLMGKFLARSKIVEILDEPENLIMGNEWDPLSKQLWTMYASNQQTQQIYIKKVNLWQYLYTYIRTVFPRYGLFLVGSTMSGFATNSSDVDMCLLLRPSHMDQRSDALNYLEQIKLALLECEFIDRAELIWAKVPILKFHDAFRDLEVDLNCNNAVGIRNTHLLHCYANMDWRARPLVLIVKMWARANNINDAKNMTISSYSLALMVIHYLQCGVTPPVVPCLHGLYPEKFTPDSDINTIDMQEQLLPFRSDNTQTLGELMLGFLRYYSTFNYTHSAISVRLGARIPIEECRLARTQKNDYHQWKLLCIEEPFDLTNTARSVYDPQIFERIKGVFFHSYHRLHDTRDLHSILNHNNTKTHSAPVENNEKL